MLDWVDISSARLFGKRRARVGVAETIRAGPSESRLETYVRIFAPDGERSGLILG